MTRTVALVTDRVSLPIDYDMPLLREACAKVGLETEVCQWEDAEVDWARFDAVVLRSPWNYVDQLPEFLAWCERVEEATLLLNPLAVARWALDKSYLADLAALGVPVVPSRFAAPGDDPDVVVRKVLEKYRDATEIVVKPGIGAYSRNVRRFTRPAAAEAAAHLSKLFGEGGHALVQPYFESVDRDGETNLIYFDREYSHAIRKAAMLMPDGTVHVPTLDFREPRVADQDERAVASAALDAAASHLGLDRPLLYGRVDLVRDDRGQPRVLELDICEPSLNLPFGDGSALRFATVLADRVDT
ncbi:RimK family alpha-L-glutamate ligase [Amycolatopsis sp. cg13]|uniref:ATP-grasp domain-containing protein n=1 Tax=Amycolatopsis sp. cg13 TaxID=3238807 RepID=UPI003525B0C1